MAFVKHGDNLPILGACGDDSEETCGKCGEKLVIFAVEGEENKLVCICELDADEE